MKPDRLLLDTHTFLWWRSDPNRLRPAARQAIAEAELVFVSAATVWEAAIKVSIGRLRLPDSIEAGVEASGFEKLPITFTHAERVTTLPLHHRDPFDRMLIAQALVEGLTLVSTDGQMAAYGVELLEA